MNKIVKIVVFILFLLLGFSLGYIVNISDIKPGEWLAFTGTIIGGIIAAISLYTTIKRAEEEVREKEVKDVRPFIIFKPEFNRDFMASIDHKTDKCHYVIDSTIENVSDKLVNDLRLLEENVYLYNLETKKYDLVDFDTMNYTIYTLLLDSREMIKPHDKFSFHTNFLIDNYSLASKEKEYTFKVVTRYTYRDILDLVEYTHYTEYDLSIKFDNNSFILFYNNLVNRTEKYKRLKTNLHQQTHSNILHK